jgi:hypothetical protein
MSTRRNHLLNSIFVIAMLTAGTTLANADPANYTPDYFIASFTLPTPLGPDLDAINEYQTSSVISRSPRQTHRPQLSWPC